VVFDSLADLEARIDDPDLPVTADSVLVLRNAGPVGAPGMPEAPEKPKRGYTELYVERVTQADKGCDFDFLSGTD
jgi:dihydroxyacid dehydratase/phosphogluconate dehydratase